MMKYRLIRNRFGMDGIFGELQNDKGQTLFNTLEHAYGPGPMYEPKLPEGVYRCFKRASNRFQCDVYEIAKVPGHTDILFHVGNYNDNSDGCVLLGMGLGHKLDGGRMITASQKAFDIFMTLMDGKDIELLVEDHR